MSTIPLASATDELLSTTLSPTVPEPWKTKAPRYPSLYQINTRVWLTELARKLGRPATLDDVDEAELDRLAEIGCDWIWLLSVWQTGPAGQAVSCASTVWRSEFRDTLPDLVDDDIGGSGFAIADYHVDRRIGGDEALARFRARLRSRGMRLMLDFVPNHTALDHPWVEEHPEFYVGGSELDLARAPHNFIWAHRKQGDRLLAHGRDPYFPGWPDTLQLNYGNPALQQAMIGELTRVAEQCDGVRCDMAMLILPDVFERTWGIRAQPFWPRATQQVRQRHKDFCFLAEVYWDLEWTLQQQGFDYTYDKRLYDRLRAGNARSVREHFWAGLDFQDKLARFLENHDEPRAAAVFAPEMHRAAAVVTFLAPGMRFFQEGQLQGWKKRVSPHLCRRPIEVTDVAIESFYARLLAVLRRPVVRSGQWRLLECTSAWEGNWTADCFVAFAWEAPGEDRLVVAVNYAANRSQCYVHLPFPDLGDRSWQLRDLLSDITYDRNGGDLSSRGLYLELEPWQAHVFALRGA
ncbi:MAG TPA: alpha-amylase family glycosyl hydrolase [Pirellulales bacterium]|nr:alpha-amylase family glycosyl hydrolase [Pirellulales bacterium]